jgi:gamma-glutamyl-gamma-aminobutyrate hydrolase PuuD
MKRILYSAMYAGVYPFEDLAEEARAVMHPSEMTETDSVLVVWGGADISPQLYNHPSSRTVYTSPTRDRVEWGCMQQAVKMGIPIIGVCRGAQMLCALAGGFLIQDVSNHAGANHTITTIDGTVMHVNSIHHQMMAGLELVDHELLAWSTAALSPRYIWKDDLVYNPPEGFKEPEMVYFPKVKGLAIQWHPEGMREESPATQFVMEKFHEFCSVSAIK